MDGTCLLKLGPSTHAGVHTVILHEDFIDALHDWGAKVPTAKLPWPQWEESGNQAGLSNAPEQG